MPDFRAYAPDATAASADIRLAPDESHHLVTVNRCGRGDPVVAFDGRGREWQCVCVEPVRSSALLQVRSTNQAAPRPHHLTLAQALPLGAAMDDIVRQATELGAARIVPLLTERTQVRLEGDRATRKLAKWRTTAIEAAKQCGNPWVPEVLPVTRLDDFLAHPGDAELRLTASLLPAATPLRVPLAAHTARAGRRPASVVWAVGPEGDFSPAEHAALALAAFAPVTLGPLVLRCDTAAVAALSVLAHLLGEPAAS